jgi:hypothetical protein
MKITKITRDPDTYNVLTVTLTPNRWEKFWGNFEEQLKVRDSGKTYRFGGGSVYYLQDGQQLGNGNYIGEAIDKWKNRW